MHLQAQGIVFYTKQSFPVNDWIKLDEAYFVYVFWVKVRFGGNHTNFLPGIPFPLLSTTYN